MPMYELDRGELRVEGVEWRVVSVRLASFVVLKTFGCRGAVLDPPVRDSLSFP